MRPGAAAVGPVAHHGEWKKQQKRSGERRWAEGTRRYCTYWRSTDPLDGRNREQQDLDLIRHTRFPSPLQLVNHQCSWASGRLVSAPCPVEGTGSGQFRYDFPEVACWIVLDLLYITVGFHLSDFPILEWRGMFFSGRIGFRLEYLLW
ncbi:hypothetical protein NDU88_001856 [Pleurodeles waltl]|uniref:Uncharacterized protein n=1 Tax=Pleurodeles waltl TaxID=8319 RepID=A0AAV7NFZ8_PLEWA|nr:hypothetical protein NDU88_001856 [Pleurodeles waltl]